VAVETHAAAELDALTPRKYGVPLSHGFCWVWHYIFGFANREMVAAGLFADPARRGPAFSSFVVRRWCIAWEAGTSLPSRWT
jgi:hypothetical protein